MSERLSTNKELIKIRIVWLGLILGQVAFAVVIAAGVRIAFGS